MKKFAALACIAAVTLANPAVAQVTGQSKAADPRAEADALGQCLVLNTSGADRVALAQWIVTAMASIPKLKDMASIDPAKKDKADQTMAAIFTRLMTVNCATEARPLMKGGSASGIRIAFETLGRMAMQEVVNGPEAEQAMGSYAKYLDENAFKKLLQ